jgi:hypothetical protein
MSGSSRPNEQMRLPGFGVPTDPWTGFQLDALTVTRVAKLKEAERAFRLVLHELDGTTEGSRPGNPRMSNAFTRLEETMMWAQLALLDP